MATTAPPRCPVCGDPLRRTVTGNIIDYRHAGTCAGPWAAPEEKR